MWNTADVDTHAKVARAAAQHRWSFGDDAWPEGMVRRLGLESTLRPRGRPKTSSNGAEKSPDAFAGLGEANERVSMRLIAWCLLPNHFHLVVWPRKEGDLSRWMQWLLTSHVRRYKSGRLPQGFLARDITDSGRRRYKLVVS